jgi:CzcA family heavy metal efflux pump
MTTSHALGRFAIRHRMVITFVCLALCAAGVYTALNLPSSVFPQTNFPRVVIMVDNGVMPADEMMAMVTRPIEEAMKDLPGEVRVRSTTGRGSAEISVFFTWKSDMVQAELHVESRLSQIRASLPATVVATTRRLTFSAFPVFGVSLTGPRRSNVDLWEMARYQIKPRFLRIPGVARVDLVGGRTPEFQIIVDPLRLAAANLTLTQVNEALAKNNQITSTGMYEENHTLYLAVVDSRVRTIPEIENLIISVSGGRAVRVRDFARVERGPEPAFNVVTSEGVPAVLITVRSQPDGSTIDIVDGLKDVMRDLKSELPPDVRLAPFYDQSLFVRASARSVWDAVFFGLVLSVVILFLFLKNWGTTLTATIVIPVTVLVTLLAMGLSGLSLNIMTLGGIAAAIGLVIDDAIVVVEAIHAKLMAGLPRMEAVESAVGELFRPLVGSTLTPVVVFIPLAFLDGITGVFFRALALTMVVALVTSLVLAVTLTPSLAAWLLRAPAKVGPPKSEEEIEAGFLLRRVLKLYEFGLRAALHNRWLTLGACVVVLLIGAGVYRRLEAEFLPEMDEGGFVIDYVAPWGTSLAETHRQLLIAEKILRAHPDVESYSRRTGAAMGYEVVEPNTGDFMVKLKADRKKSSNQVIADLRASFNAVLPDIEWEFPGILVDVIGDLTSEPQPIEVKLFSPDIEFLKKKAPEVEEQIGKIKGVVDTKSGLVYAGPSLNMRPKMAEMQRFGLTASDIAAVVNTAMLGETTSSVLDGDRVIAVRVKVDPARIGRVSALGDLPVRTADGMLLKLSQLVDFVETPGQLELHREDLRQNVAVTARLEGRDLGSAIADIKRKLSLDKSIPPGTIEYGGLYKQQEESFRNLVLVLALAVFLVFTILLVEFGSFYEPVAIVFGAVLAMVGAVMGLWITETSLNVVSFLGAIIGVGIVAKNGILMLDFVEHLRRGGVGLEEALVRSGHRRLRPVLMTSMAAAFGMAPLAYGVGNGADMLQPLAIAVIGALCTSVLLSLVATPTVYYLLRRMFSDEAGVQKPL